MKKNKQKSFWEARGYLEYDELFRISISWEILAATNVEILKYH